MRLKTSSHKNNILNTENTYINGKIYLLSLSVVLVCRDPTKQVTRDLEGSEFLIMSLPWSVNKFGGTSLGNASYMQLCIAIVKDLLGSKRIAMVVSAMGGKPKVTDMLLDAVHAASREDSIEREDLINAIFTKHGNAIDELLADAPEEVARLKSIVSKDLENIRDILKAVTLMRVAHEPVLELVSGYGEIWSAQIIAAAMRHMGMPFEYLNAREVLRIAREDIAGQSVLWEHSQELLERVIQRREEELGYAPNFVITGYVASTEEGFATTLKRDGSDFSAAIFAKLLDADAITIWTDVSGVFSADPRRVPDAQVIAEITYNEAVELAYFGAKVIHPKTMAPAIAKNIPIYIKNTFEPLAAGTRIFKAQQRLKEKPLQREGTVCGFSTVDHVALLNIDGTGMIGVSGIASRLFSALEEAQVPVMFVAQASSEHSICFATKMHKAALAKATVENKFFFELSKGLITNVSIIQDCSIIAAVGESMGSLPGVAGIFFNALGNAGINILSISQGCDERNISAVVLKKDSARALQVVHSAFWLSSRSISVGVVGTGNVGSALIQTLLEQAPLFQERFDLKLHIVAAMNKHRMLLADGDDLSEELMTKLSVFRRRLSSGRLEPGELMHSHSNCSLEDMASAMSKDEQVAGITPVEADINQLFEHVSMNRASPHFIMIDCTNSKEVGAMHPQWLRDGAHVITANKGAVTRGIDLYNEILDAVRFHRRGYFSEVTIGSAVPVLTTLNDIMVSGDALHGITGIMNVACQTILSRVMDGISLRDAMAEVHERNLFESDPREDLDGTEAGCKVLILARQIGLPLNIEDINREPLVTIGPDDDVDWENLRSSHMFEERGKELARLAAEAKANDSTLRYVQRIEVSPSVESGVQKNVKVTTSVKLEAVPNNTDLALVQGPVYFFSFHTERYKQSPLIVKGPLSDSANTASGMVGDLLRIAKTIGIDDKGQSKLTAWND